jgi:N-hydroxyarylamine O-acetyltransferase
MNTVPPGDAAPLMARYLERLDAQVFDAPALHTLRDLMTRHQQIVPFENLDGLHGSAPPLSPAGVLHMGVGGRRGGFCYELNEAFGALLTHLGFSVRRIEARVFSEARQKFGAPFDHLALMVSLPEGEFLVDVGFGDCNRSPLRFPEDTLTDISGRYSLAQASDERWLLSRAGHPLYEMTLADQPLSAFEPMYRYHKSSPESVFSQGLICTKATPAGRVTVSRDRLIIVAGLERTETLITDLSRVLREHFDLHDEAPPA